MKFIVFYATSIIPHNNDLIILYGSTGINAQIIYYQITQ